MTVAQGGLVLILLFVLRCLVPLAIVLGVGYLMNRLVDKWEAEEAAQEPAPAYHHPTGIPKRTVPKLPCWLVNKCSPEQRDTCPVYADRSVLCWQVWQEIEDGLPKKCTNCPVYDSTVTAQPAT